MSTNYTDKLKLALEIGAKVLREIVENNYKTSGILNFGTFLDVRKHELFHGWKPDVTCCDPKCFHLARSSRALIFDKQWSLLYKRIRHRHNVDYPFCPCQYMKSNVTLSDLDIMTLSQIVHITSSNLSSTVINAITELRIRWNNLSHSKSMKFNKEGWSSVEQAVLILAGTISTNYQQEIKEEINQFQIRGHAFGAFSLFSSSSEKVKNLSRLSSPPTDWSVYSTRSESVGNRSTVISPPTTSINFMMIEDKLQEIHKDISDIKADITLIKQRYATSEKEVLRKESELESREVVVGDLEARLIKEESSELVNSDLEAQLKAVFEQLVSNMEKQHSEISQKIDKLEDRIIDKDIDKIHHKLEILENQNIDFSRKIDNITNLSKSRHSVPESIRSQPVSVQNTRIIKETLRPHMNQKTLLPRDDAVTDNSVISIENESDKLSSTKPETTKRVHLPRGRDVKQYVESFSSDKPNTPIINEDKDSKNTDDETFANKAGNVSFRKEDNKAKNLIPDVEADKIRIPDERFRNNQRSFKESGYHSFRDEVNQKLSPVTSDRPEGSVKDSLDSQEEILDHEKYAQNDILNTNNSMQGDAEVHTSHTSSDTPEDTGMHKSPELDIIYDTSEVHKPHTIGKTPGDPRVLEPSKTEDTQSQISMEADGERVSDLLDEVLDNAIERGEIEIETENDDLPNLSSTGSSSVISKELKSTNAEFQGQDEDFKIVNFLDFAGLPHTDEFKDIVDQAIKVHTTEHCRSVGMDTIICLDASASLKGKLGDQMKSVALSLTHQSSTSLNGKLGDQMKSVTLSCKIYIENVAITQGLEENIGIVVFGREIKILQVLTNNYLKVRQAIEQVTIDGTSPLLTGLLLSYIALEESGGSTSIYEHIVNPRIILLTDGRPTDDTKMSNFTIENAEKTPEVRQKNVAFAEKLHSKGYSIFCVTIGQSSNKDFLDELSYVTDGKTFNMDKTEELAKHFQYHNIIGKVEARMPDQFDSIEFENILTDELKKNAPNFYQEDTSNIKDILKNKGMLFYEEYKSLPKIGTRVCDISASAGGSLFGTIIKHISRNEVTILWDDQSEDKREIHDDIKDIEVVNGPRKLKKDELIIEGVRVMRGAAWKNEYGEHDGGIGSSGVVYRVTKEGDVKVRWDNGRKGKYRFNGAEEQRNEVKVHESSLWVKNPFGKKTESIGMLVTPEVIGTGFRVGEKYVITAYHIVEDNIATLKIKFPTNAEKEDQTVYTFESFYLKTTVVYFNVELDIAVLELEECTKSYPPPVEIYTGFLTSSQIENLHVLGFCKDGYLKVLKCKINRRKTYDVPYVNYTGEQFTEQLEERRQINDPNKIILRCSHWQNGMDGSVGLAEIDNNIFVVFIYLKSYENLKFGQSVEQHLGKESSPMTEEGVLFKTITELMKGDNPKLSKSVLLPEFKMIWQIQHEDWSDVPVEVNDKLEMSFTQKEEKTCIFTFQGYSIRVLFKTMKARYVGSGYTHQVRRILKHVH